MLKSTDPKVTYKGRYIRLHDTDSSVILYFQFPTTNYSQNENWFCFLNSEYFNKKKLDKELIVLNRF